MPLEGLLTDMAGDLREIARNSGRITTEIAAAREELVGAIERLTRAVQAQTVAQIIVGTAEREDWTYLFDEARRIVNERG
ncbi:MAG: hypothetical protein GY937_22955 [bacterium]|nr:hypothetical protein [bacterium]